MSTATCPRTTIGGVSQPRLWIGANWISGFSHTGPAADQGFKARNSTPDSVSRIIVAFLQYDMNAVMGLFGIDPNLLDAVHLALEHPGKNK